MYPYRVEGIVCVASLATWMLMDWPNTLVASESARNLNKRRIVKSAEGPMVKRPKTGAFYVKAPQSSNVMVATHIRGMAIWRYDYQEWEHVLETSRHGVRLVQHSPSS